ncbi:MAG: formylglycine-generating enzyme family protein [Nitrospinota bacterium]|jgi:formylglycine-generating enzyme required for sulfatase activity|nr:Sulphatase-modifying factor protein [Nitrospinota bacterium]MDP7351096.1 formylglycine-generating enzyme family protein [Nitrospinota bacterium]HJN01537.1 formylglycine-generating enzyme family protein [Nitrospinota bacterium]
MKKIILSFFIVFLLTNISVGEEKKGFEGMVFIKGGCFEMGDTFGDGSSDEKSVHEVCVDDFFIGEHEVTQREWEEIMGNNPSYFKNCGDNCPVEQVAYDDVQKYIRRLNIKTGLNYRLPTEAEWEYAAREGGRIVRFGTGKDTIGPDEANFDASSKYKKPYSRSGVYREKTVPVKSFSPNSLGLYDLSGNVWEWVQDWYDTGYYKRSPRNNPKGPSSGSGRVMRGGSWYDLPRRVRAAFRFGDAPSGRVSVTGFRLALEVSGQD